jgi:hypothetical protein
MFPDKMQLLSASTCCNPLHSLYPSSDIRSFLFRLGDIMRLVNWRSIVFVALLSMATMLLPTAPAAALPAAKTITIKITEAQFDRYLRKEVVGPIRKVKTDIADPALILNVFTRFADIPELVQVDFHFGVFVRDGVLVCESGIINFPGYGAVGYEEIKQIAPDLAKNLDNIGGDLLKFILRSVKNKAGSKYTYESVSLAGDVLTIVVVK